MREREGSEIFDVSEQFSKARLKEFREFLKSISGAKVTVTADMDQVPEPGQLRNLISYSGEQISKFTIRATVQEHDDNLELFTIPGVKWEKIEK